jgi:hypothetical protein
MAGLTGAIAAGQALGHGTLAGPPLTTPSAWPAWLDGRDPLVAAMAILRLGMLAVCWYLAVLTAVAAAARAVAGARGLAVAARAAPVPVRRILHAALGAGVVLATALPRPSAPVAIGKVPLAAADAGPAPTRTLRRLEASPAPQAPTTGVPPAPAPTPPPPPPPPVPEPAAPRSPAPPPAPPTGPAAEAEWVVSPGEHFWSIARQRLTAAWGRPPARHQVGRYWRELVAANRDRLADPANPDLLFAGQRLRLPPPPPDPIGRA